MDKIELSMEELQKAIENGVAEAAKKQGLDQVDKKHGVFPNSDLTPENSTKEQRVKTWIRALAFGDPDDVAMVKYLYTAATAGLGWVPEEFKTDVIRVAENFGVVRRFATVYNTDLQVVNLHQANGVTTVAYTTEVNQISASTPSFTEPSITIKKLAGITSISNELLKDAKFNVLGYLSELFGEAIAGAEDSQGLVGTGSPYHGLVGGTITGQVSNTAAAAASYSNFTPKDLLNTAMSLAEKYRSGAAWFMHPTILAALTSAFETTVGDPILRTPREGALATSIYGYPVITSEKLPSSDAASTKFVGFANPKRLTFITNGGLDVAIGTEGTVGSDNLFEKDMSAVRVTSRNGMLWTLGAGTAVLSTHA